ncbi:hypothetical protein AB0H92_45925 [Streptomyces phaeochromogenes]|uniref:hypothetical protein n=1 Tax=Streptomyces phaeochromogenes TaxID=1923 RepID=UPI003403F8AD
MSLPADSPLDDIIDTLMARSANGAYEDDAAILAARQRDGRCYQPAPPMSVAA